MKRHMANGTKRRLILAAVVVAAIVIAIWAVAFVPIPPPFNPRPSRDIRGDIELFYMIKTALSTINAVLLVFLLISYVELYQKIKSEFTIALTIFAVVLLLHALTSNPLLQRIFGFQAFGLGPFAMLPDLFTCAAIMILVYLVLKY